MIKRKVLPFLSIVILCISLSLLVWSLSPSRKEIRRQNLHPTQMQLPTPQGRQLAPDVWSAQATAGIWRE